MEMIVPKMMAIPEFKMGVSGINLNKLIFTRNKDTSAIRI